MSDKETWLTAAEASKVLRVTQRQVNRYGALGRLRTKRIGRRVLYLASDVAALADDLQVDNRPLPSPRSEGGALLPPEVVRHLSEEADARRRMEDRLQRIEQRVDQPVAFTPPRWLVILGAVVVVLVIGSFVLLLFLATR